MTVLALPRYYMDHYLHHLGQMSLSIAFKCLLGEERYVPSALPTSLLSIKNNFRIRHYWTIITTTSFNTITAAHGSTTTIQVPTTTTSLRATPTAFSSTVARLERCYGQVNISKLNRHNRACNNNNKHNWPCNNSSNNNERKIPVNDNKTINMFWSR